MKEFDRYTEAYWLSHKDEHKEITQEHLERANQGKDRWNAWAKEFGQWIRKQAISDACINVSHVEIPNRIIFDGFNFPAIVDFSSATFTEGAEFSSATFTEGAEFSGATFTEYADFSGMTFTELTLFNDAIFTELAIFSGTTFTKGALFSGTTFTEVAHFSNTEFNSILNIQSANFKNEAPEFNFATFKQPPYLAQIEHSFIAKGENVERYRKLKHMAIDAKDYQNELKFFGYETHARAYIKGATWYERCFVKTYYYLSHFGASIARPLASTIVLLVALFLINITVIKPDSKDCIDDANTFISQVSIYTFSQALPIIKLDKEEKQTMKNCLFGDNPLEGKHHLWRLVHLIPTGFMLFLFGLAIRNRFKIK